MEAKRVVLFDHLRFKAALTVTRNIYLERTIFGNERFTGIAIAAIARH